jgi:hypothetical protein
MFLVYSNYKVFKSKLFADLILQSSPKNSFFYRILKSRLGFYISSIFSYSFNTPNANLNYLGIIKMDRYILFELDNNNIPIHVWRKSSDQSWIKEQFIGFQLLSEYSLAEFHNQSSIIEKAFHLKWQELNQKNLSHGDFTHFNILVDTDQKIHFIDYKAHQNSKLFDFFYFYSYLEQCLDRCQSISDSDKLSILKSLEDIILKVCDYSSDIDFFNDCNTIIIPEKWGLLDIDKKKYFRIFKQRISDRFNNTL